MDRIENYRRIIGDVLTPFTKIKYANGDFQNQLVFDRENDRYLVMS